MNKRIVSLLRCSALIIGLTLLFPRANSYAGSPNESLTPSLKSPAAQEDTSTLNRRFLAVKKDLAQFLVFAEYSTTTGDTKTVEQLHSPVDDFLKRHVDNLLIQGSEQVSLETTRLSAELMFIKTRLLLILNQIEPARITVAEMKKRFGPYQKITVQVSEKSTTLTEAIRMLDEELTKTVTTKKK